MKVKPWIRKVNEDGPEPWGLWIPHVGIVRFATWEECIALLNAVITERRRHLALSFLA